MSSIFKVGYYDSKKFEKTGKFKSYKPSIIIKPYTSLNSYYKILVLKYYIIIY